MMTDSQKASKDWRALTNEIMSRVFAPLKKPEYETSYAAGKTKILMNSEINIVLEKSRVKAS
jgi:hypothetical protein